jgi:hypothetical protein
VPHTSVLRVGVLTLIVRFLFALSGGCQGVAAFSRDKKEPARSAHLAAAGGCEGIAAARVGWSLP